MHCLNQDKTDTIRSAVENGHKNEQRSVQQILKLTFNTRKKSNDVIVNLFN